MAPSKPVRSCVRLAWLALLLLTVQSNFCRIQVDNDNDHKDEDGRTETLMLPPVFDTLGRPRTGPIPIVIPVPGTSEPVRR